MDLNAAKDLDTPGWRGVRLAAIVLFAIAGALLMATLLAPSGVRAEAGFSTASASPGSEVPRLAAH